MASIRHSAPGGKGQAGGPNPRARGRRYQQDWQSHHHAIGNIFDIATVLQMYHFGVACPAAGEGLWLPPPGSGPNVGIVLFGAWTAYCFRLFSHTVHQPQQNDCIVKQVAKGRRPASQKEKSPSMPAARCGYGPKTRNRPPGEQLLFTAALLQCLPEHKTTSSAIDGHPSNGQPATRS